MKYKLSFSIIIIFLSLPLEVFSKDNNTFLLKGFEKLISGLINYDLLSNDPYNPSGEELYEIDYEDLVSWEYDDGGPLTYFNWEKYDNIFRVYAPEIQYKRYSLIRKISEWRPIDTRLYNFQKLENNQTKNALVLKLLVENFDGEVTKNNSDPFCSKALSIFEKGLGKVDNIIQFEPEKIYRPFNSIFPLNSLILAQKSFGKKDVRFTCNAVFDRRYWSGPVAKVDGKRFLSNSTKNERKNLQKILNFYGFDAGKIDGALGPKTQKALNKYAQCVGEYQRHFSLKKLKLKGWSGFFSFSYHEYLAMLGIYSQLEQNYASNCDELAAKATKISKIELGVIFSIPNELKEFKSFPWLSCELFNSNGDTFDETIGIDIYDYSSGGLSQEQVAIYTIDNTPFPFVGYVKNSAIYLTEFSKPGDKVNNYEMIIDRRDGSASLKFSDGATLKGNCFKTDPDEKLF